MRRQILLSLGVLVCMGGCSLAPKYTQPPAPIPEEWPQGDAYQATQATPSAPTIPELSWRSFSPTNSFGKLLKWPWTTTVICGLPP